MTETAPETPTVECVVPEGKTARQLTVGELSWVSRKIGRDVLAAIAEQGSPDMYDGFAHLALAWKRRVDPGATIDQFRALELNELLQTLGFNRPASDDEPPEAEDTSADPTDSTPG